MTPQELAAMLHGREYPHEVANVDAKLAKEHGLVIVSGGSDDIMYFAGVLCEELGAYGGSIVFVDAEGIIPTFEILCDDRNEEGLRRYFRNEDKQHSIKAIWAKDDISWQYNTDIPHETFDLMEDGKVYCREIVFAMADIER